SSSSGGGGDGGSSAGGLRSVGLALALVAILLSLAIGVALRTPARSGPLQVAVLPFANGAPNQADFAWLSDAIPEFVSGQLGQQQHLVLVPPADVSAAMGEGFNPQNPSQRRSLLAAVGADIVVTGRFYAVNEQVGVTAVVEDAEGKPIQVTKPNPTLFPKEQVLDQLNAMAERIAGTLGRLAQPAETQRSGDMPATLAKANPEASDMLSEEAM
ncbi:MAG TPA: hypothetical protein DEA08_32290, partial [Planctomycetes bacterium]|nr:hypothetical protein [Planctomycetota bacterium]